MTTITSDFESMSLGIAAEAYARRIDNLATLRTKLLNAESEYSQYLKDNEQIEKVLGERIGNNCVVISKERIVMTNNNGFSTNRSIIIKQGVK